MSIQEVSPGRFVVQKFAADPLGGAPRRWCKRAQGREAAEQQERTFEAEANEWTARQRLIGQARAKGVALALPSMPTSANGFADFLEEIYLPRARKKLDPQTMRARAPSIMILAQDLGNTPLHQIENQIDELVARWRA
ncbi:MAG: hypothetical protein WBP56_04825, partial [Polyangia bacterium]